jgi:hypothetical protein
VSADGALANVVDALTRPRLVSENWPKVSMFQSLTEADGAELLRRWKLPNRPTPNVLSALTQLSSPETSGVTRAYSVSDWS